MDVRGACIGLAVLMLAGCKPAGFAAQEVDLMRQPPPLLPSDANAFWNDRASGVYGEISVGPDLYRNGPAQCRTARVTAIDASHASSDRILLYCGADDGTFRFEPSLSCRQAGANLACRTPQGDAVTLPRVR